MSFDFGALKRLWLKSIEEALTSIEFGRGERLYAIAFWLFYAEIGAVIYPPVVGLGEETAWQEAWGSEGRDAGFGSGRWNPADWKHDMLTLPRADAIKAAYIPSEYFCNLCFSGQLTRESQGQTSRIFTR